MPGRKVAHRRRPQTTQICRYGLPPYRLTIMSYILVGESPTQTWQAHVPLSRLPIKKHFRCRQNAASLERIKILNWAAGVQSYGSDVGDDFIIRDEWVECGRCNRRLPTDDGCCCCCRHCRRLSREMLWFTAIILMRPLHDTGRSLSVYLFLGVGFCFQLGRSNRQSISDCRPVPYRARGWADRLVDPRRHVPDP